MAVITGAASGIGYGLAERAAKEGMKVVLADVEKDALVKAEKDIRALGVDTLSIRTDVSKAEDVKALADKTLDAFKAVHLLFNNAGVSAGSTSWESTLDDWKWVLGVNLWGVIHGVHFFVPIMLKQNTECHILNTGSLAGISNNAGRDTYLVSKHGVVALSEALYRELELVGHHIGVSVICPGIINTNLGESSRNRPAELQNTPSQKSIYISEPKVQELMDLYKEERSKAMLPQQVADIVFKAIVEKKFYILPNAEPFAPWIKARVEDILQGHNPTPLPHPRFR